MEIGTLSVNRNIPVTHIVKARYSPGKIALPVKNSQFLYSNFKHVSGIPAVYSQGEGYSLTKLRALDNLIERLGELGKPMDNILPKGKAEPGLISKVINRLAGELHDVTTQANPFTGYGADTGLLVNISV